MGQERVRARKKRMIKRIVEGLMLNGWSVDEIFSDATIEKDGLKVRIFHDMRMLDGMVKEIRESWTTERDDIVQDRTVSLNKTVRFIDMQMAGLSRRLNDEDGLDAESETKRINIGKRITELALARHSLIAGEATAKMREKAGYVPR